MDTRSSTSVENSAPLAPTSPLPFFGLPTELRLQIWHLAIPDGVYISFSRHPNQENVSQHLIARCSPRAVPAMLHTNAEARWVALQYFKILGIGSSLAYFNPVVDTLMIGMIFRTNFLAIAEYPSMILGDNAWRIQHIALHNSRFFHSRTLQDGAIRRFTNLQSFAILDLWEWEQEKKMGFDGLREVLGPRRLRAEDLVRLEEQELMGTENGDVRRVVEQLLSLWKRMRKSDLDVMVVRLPFTGFVDGEASDEGNHDRKPVLKQSAERSLTGDRKVDERSGPLWRSVRKLLIQRYRRAKRHWRD